LRRRGPSGIRRKVTFRTRRMMRWRLNRDLSERSSLYSKKMRSLRETLESTESRCIQLEVRASGSPLASTSRLLWLARLPMRNTLVALTRALL
jgi:hypothetical protein